MRKKVIIAFAIFMLSLIFFINMMSSLDSNLSVNLAAIIASAATIYFWKKYKIEVEDLNPPEIQDSLHPLHGTLVVSFKDESLNKHVATKQDILDAIPSKYPLPYIDTGIDEYDILAKRANEYSHYDGHLYIGGGFHWDGKGHIITVGGSRVGYKGAALIVPALLSLANMYPNCQSYICLDPKGENLAICGSLLNKCGYNIICINPFGIKEVESFGNKGFNVFDTFSFDTPNFDQFVDMITNAIIPPVKHENDFWDKSARNTISFYIRHMMTQDDEPKNFTTLWRWLRYASEKRADLLLKMMENQSFDGDLSQEAEAMAGLLSGGGSEQAENIYATIRAYTDIFKDSQLRKSISESDFDITKIAQKKTAIFVCINPSELQTNQVWLRLLFGSFIRSLTKFYNKDRKVVMIMDEFPTLGHFHEFEIMSGFMAGYNVTLWPVIQDLTQLSSLYPSSWETFINNSVIRHFTGIGDNFTAEYVSKRMPIIEKGHEKNPYREPFFRADQVLNRPEIIVFMSGVKKPILFDKFPYWKLPCGQNASPNPFL